MSGYVLRRILASLPTLLALIGLTFALLRAIPGDPADARASEAAAARVDRAAVEGLRRQFGLDRAPAAQFLDWAGRCLRFDFGASFADGAPVSRKIGRAFLATAILNGTALLLLLSFSLAAGTLLAARAGSGLDVWGGRLLAALAGLPVAWGAILLQRLLAVDLGLLPLQGASPAGASPGSALLAFRPEYLCLPALAVSYRGAALYSRLVRQAVVQTLRADYLTTARARGVPLRLLYLRHALRNAALPLISTTAALAPAVLAGNVVVENVFGWPGAGRLFVDALLARDYAVLLALIWIGSLFTLAALLAADLLLGFADPRVRVQGSEAAGG